MKKSLPLIATFLLGSSPTLADEVRTYGKPLTLRETTKVSDILAKPEAFAGKRVRVEGAVVEVCKVRGCWMKIASDKESESIRFKVDDGVITIPADARGKTAQVEGIVTVSTLSVEDQTKQGEHCAQEEGKPFDRSSVKGPVTVVQLRGEGAEIR